MMPLRWGLVGTGRISQDFTHCLKSIRNDANKIVAVADLTLAQATQFATEHGIPKAYGSAAELAVDSEIDIIHVGVWNTQHFKIAKMMLENGKHVLCEKPMGVSVKEVEELVKIAKEHKRFLMEGIWTCSFPIYEKIRKELSDRTIGQISLVQATLSLNIAGIERIVKYNLGGGAIFDLGIYAIYLATLVFKGEKPQRIRASGYVNEEGVDEVAVMTLEYSNQRIATLTTSIRCHGWNEAIICGTTGILRIAPPFHCPTTMTAPKTTYNINLPEVNHQMNHMNSQGLTYEIEVIRKCIQDDLLECPLMTWNDSLTIHSITEEARKQLGAKMH